MKTRRHRIAMRRMLWAHVLVAGIAAQHATAQSAGSVRSLADTAEADAVQQRSRPQYDAVGIDVGAFRILPTLRAGATYDDNIFNSNVVRTGDVILTVRPAATISSLWSRHSLTFDANALIERYGSTSEANASQYGVGVTGNYDIARLAALGFTARRARMVEPRGSLGDILIGGEPSRYDDTSVGFNTTFAFANAAVVASAGVAKFDYASIRVGDVVFSQNFRDRQQRDMALRASWALGPSLRLVASGSYNQQRYRQRIGSIDQDSDGYNLLGGISFALTELVSGEVGLGYIAQSYREAAFGTISGFSYNGRVTWNPTRLTTLTLRANKTIQQSPFVSQSGIAEDQVSLTADHELLRNLILNATATLVRDSYRELSRTDNRQSFSLAGRLLVNRHVEAELRAGHRRQTSDGISPRPYSGSSIALSLMLKR